MYKTLIINHVVLGSLALLSGLIIMLLPKGSRFHVRLGWLYTICMFLVCASAFSIIAFYRFSFFLMVIGVLTFYSTFVGIRVSRRKKDGAVQWYDWLVAIFTCAFGIGLIGYGVGLIIKIQAFHALILLSFIFGVFTFNNGWTDLVAFRKKDFGNRKWWLRQHISAMGGSYIAAVTAFAVQNGQIFLSDTSWHWTLWVLPGVIGGIIISRTTEKMGLKAG